jgi:hypothetical protein
VRSEALHHRPPSHDDPPRLYHLDGVPVRAAVCSGDLFLASPQEQEARRQLDVRQWCVPGVYLLLAFDESAPASVYVGSGQDLVSRVGAQRKERDDWSTAVLITGVGVTRGDAYQLERAVGDSIVRSTTPGIIEPAWEKHPKVSPLDVPWPLRDSFIVLAERCLGQDPELDIHVRLIP